MLDQMKAEHYPELCNGDKLMEINGDENLFVSADAEKLAKRIRFGEKEQRRERALTFEKSRGKRYKACSDVVHRGNPNPNRLSDLHGVSARGDGSPLSRLSVADQTAPKARHQKRGNPVRISPFLSKPHEKDIFDVLLVGIELLYRIGLQRNHELSFILFTYLSNSLNALICTCPCPVGT